MNDGHLTDEQLQQFAEKPDKMDSSLMIHLKECEGCKSRVQNYSALYAGLNAMEKPRFNFDLTELVITRLSSQNLKFPIMAILSAGFGTIFIVLIALIYSPQLAILFHGSSNIELYMMIIPASVILTLQAFTYLKEYKQTEVELISRTCNLNSFVRSYQY